MKSHLKVTLSLSLYLCIFTTNFDRGRF
jgi:hypothetical protein